MPPTEPAEAPVTRGWSLRTRFVLAALACVLPLLGVAVYILFESLENNENQLIDTETAIANVVATTLQAALTENEGVLTTLASQAEVQRLTETSSQPALAEVVKIRQSIGGLILLEDMGEAPPDVIATAGVNATDILTLIDGPLRRALAGETGVSNPVEVDESGYVVLAVSVPAANVIGGSTRNPGILAALLKVERIAGQFTPWAGQDTVITVSSEDHVIASSAAMPADDSFPTRLAEPIERAIAGEEGTYAFDAANGDERLAVFTPVEFGGADWAVLVTSSSPRAYGPNRTLLQNGLIALGLAGALALVLALVLGEFSARPLRRLSAQAGAMAHGDFSRRIDPAGGGEVRSLGSAFREMEDQLSRQVQDLETARLDRERQAVELRDLHRRTVRLQEDERRRIASEIHDAVSPLITGALYQARALRMTNGSTPPEERDEELDAVADLLGRAGDELHGVIFALRPPDLDDLGVVPAIERYIQTIQRTGLNVRFELVGEPPALTPEIRLGIYRIVQEALHNVVRHADADEAVVRFDASSDLLRVVVRDNGSGFDPDRAQGPTSLGILSMRERAAAIGATFEIASRAGGGTVLVIERPDADAVTPEPGGAGAGSGANGAGDGEGDAKSANGYHQQADRLDRETLAGTDANSEGSRR